MLTKTIRKTIENFFFPKSKKKKQQKNIWAYGPGEATAKIWKKSMQ